MRKPRLLDTDLFSHVYLPHGYVSVIDDADLGLACQLTLYRGTNGYVYYSVWKDGKSCPCTFHSLLIPPIRGMHIDHVNGDKLDNRRTNLRQVSVQTNQANRRKRNRNNKSGTRGVQYTPHLSQLKPWRAQIMANRRAVHLGLFGTKDEAIDARRRAEMRFFGEHCP